jgi:hypothetical protein
VGQQVRVLQVGQLNQTNPIRERASEVMGNPQGEAGLADTTHPGQGHEPIGGEELSDSVGLGSTAHEARQIRG